MGKPKPVLAPVKTLPAAGSSGSGSGSSAGPPLFRDSFIAYIPGRTPFPIVRRADPDWRDTLANPPRITHPRHPRSYSVDGPAPSMSLSGAAAAATAAISESAAHGRPRSVATEYNSYNSGQPLYFSAAAGAHGKSATATEDGSGEHFGDDNDDDDDYDYDDDGDDGALGEITDYIVYFLPGNPGMIDFYRPYLQLLADLLQAQTRHPRARVVLMSRSHYGFERFPADYGPVPASPGRPAHAHAHAHTHTHSDPLGISQLVCSVWTLPASSVEEQVRRYYVDLAELADRWTASWRADERAVRKHAPPARPDLSPPPISPLSPASVPMSSYTTKPTRPSRAQSTSAVRPELASSPFSPAAVAAAAAAARQQQQQHRGAGRRRRRQPRRRAKFIFVGHSIGAYFGMRLTEMFGERISRAGWLPAWGPDGVQLGIAPGKKDDGAGGCATPAALVQANHGSKEELKNGRLEIGVAGQVLLFPTVVEMRKSRNGRVFSFFTHFQLFYIPLFIVSRLIARLPYLLFFILMRTLAIALSIPILAHPVVADLLRIDGGNGLTRCVTLAVTEIKTVTEDSFSPWVWGIGPRRPRSSASVEHCRRQSTQSELETQPLEPIAESPPTSTQTAVQHQNEPLAPRLFALFATRDGWVDSAARDALVKQKGELADMLEREHVGAEALNVLTGEAPLPFRRPVFEIDDTGYEHAFVLDSKATTEVAEKTAEWVQAVIAEDMAEDR